MAGQDEKQGKTKALRAGLLEWYDRNRRDLPWRRSRDSYAIWVAEIMLQQTRVAVVVERYQQFLERFPTLVALALAPEQDVLAMWSGLGYYRRARMLHKAAQFVSENLQGNLPAKAEELRGLPGIGVYTAAAVASIAHDEPVAVVDGNVERVLCRFAGWGAGSRKGGGTALRRKVEELARRFLDRTRPGDFNQAMMELGATVCMPRNPQCAACPLTAECKTRGEHKTTRRAPMTSRVAGYGLVLRAAPRPSRRRGGEHGAGAAGAAAGRRDSDAGDVGAADAAACGGSAKRAADGVAARDHAGELLRAHPQRGRGGFGGDDGGRRGAALGCGCARPPGWR